MINLPALYLMSTLHLLQTDSHAWLFSYLDLPDKCSYVLCVDHKER